MRPFGVTLVSLYQFLRAVIGMIFGGFILFFDGPSNKFVSEAAVGNPVERFVGHFAHHAGLIIIAVALVHAVAGYGLLRMRRWGRMLTILFSAIELALVLPTVIQMNQFSIYFGAFNALCILYLAMPPTRRAFASGQQHLQAA
jgi:hypothetical protein